MSADKLYEILSESRDTSIPWDKAAEHFMHMKLASGGLTVQEVTLLKLAAEGKLSPEEIQHAVNQGTISGIRSSVMQDMTRRLRLKSSRGEHIGRELGGVAGMVAGLAKSKGKTLGSKALHAAAGYIGGRGVGKVIGQEVDSRKKVAGINARALFQMLSQHSGDITDPAVDAALPGFAKNDPEGAIGDALRTAGGVFGEAVGHKYRVPRAGTIAGALAGDRLSRSISKHGSAAKDILLQAIRGLRKEANGEQPRQAANPDATEEQASMNTFPNTDEMGDAPEADPVINVPEDLQSNPLDEVLQMHQKANETDFYQDKAMQAEEQASAAHEHAQLMEDQLNQILEQFQTMQAETQAREQATQEQTSMLSQQAQAAQQDAMAARDESLQSQQQNIAMRQGITSWRQQLMDMISQDPLMGMAPPSVPTGPMQAPAPGQPGTEPDPNMPQPAGPSQEEMMGMPTPPPEEGGAPEQAPQGQAPAAPPAPEQPAQPAASGPPAPKAESAPKAPSEKKPSAEKAPAPKKSGTKITVES